MDNDTRPLMRRHKPPASTRPHSLQDFSQKTQKQHKAEAKRKHVSAAHARGPPPAGVCKCEA